MAEYVEDGTFNFSLGQDSWHTPEQIQENQYWRGVNVTTRGGTLSPRPPVEELELHFEDKTIKTDYGYFRTIEDIWRAGKFQAFIPHPVAPENYIITVISGLIFQTNIRTGMTVLRSEDIKTSQYVSRINWSYAGDDIVLFDFPDYPIVVGENKVYRSSPNHEIEGVSAPQTPISNLGTFNQNRLFVADLTVNFTAGDPVGNLLTPEAPITFTEVLTPSSPFYRQFFSLPTVDFHSPATAMGFIQELDSSTGVGPMFISTAEKFYFFRTNQPREDWDKGQFGGILLANAGVAGPRAFINVNSDLIFLSAQGKVHALSNARNDTKKWGNVSVSREVENYLAFHDISLARFAVLGFFDNRIFITANPYRMTAQDVSRRPVTDYAHGGLVVLEIDNLASLLTQGALDWAGLWTGINPMDMGRVGSKFFIISKDGANPNGANRIYELKKEGTVDKIGKVKRRIRSIVYTKQYNFKQEATQKREHSLAVHLTNIEGEFDLKIERKPTHCSSFLEYANWEHFAPVEFCYDMPTDEFMNGAAPHQFKQLIFGDPKEEGCSPLTQDEYNTFHGTQLRLTLEGDYWTLNYVKMRAQIIPLEERQEEYLCEKLPSIRIPLQCEPDWLVPEESVCLAQ